MTTANKKKAYAFRFFRRGDNLYLDGKKITLFLSKEQEGKGAIVGTDLESVVGRSLNDDHLDHLLEHPELIPESWKKDEEGNIRRIFFWGRVYRMAGYDRFGDYVKFLYWGNPWWQAGQQRLLCEWSACDPAAVRAS